MKRFSVLLLVLLGAAAVFLYGCLSDLASPGHLNPLDPDHPTSGSVEPSRPSGLGAVVADRLVVLSWSVSDTTGIENFKIYRWQVVEGESEDHEVIGSSDEMEYEDDQVRNGQEYSYKISAVNRNGLEGVTSYAMSATPRIFSISIESGRKKTGSRTVAITSSASTIVQLMMISDNADMSGGQWQPYQGTISWQLPVGDGTKTVYACFRDSEDNESQIVNDDIELDTAAFIELVSEDTGGGPMSVGETIHFLLDAGEPDGQAAVDIGSVAMAIGLFDDGTGGDPVADDGVYERDFVVEAGTEVISAVVIGRFTDEVGNEAEPLQAIGMVTILEPPEPVELEPPVALSKRRLALSWSRNNDYDFDRYKVYRSYVPGVEISTEIELLTEITTQGETNYNDGGLEPDSTYYYAVYVVDDIGQSVISNEVAGTTLINEVPDPVVIYEPWAADSTSLELSWSQSEEDDFMAYEVIGWEEVPPDPPNWGGKRLIARITTIGETFYTHESLVDSIIYWYQVAIVDSFGASAVSDSVFGSPRPMP
jgi:fibronectin type 3 domain-containing protein